MATKQPTMGVNHPTVVPENYDADTDVDTTDDDATAADDDAAATADGASQE